MEATDFGGIWDRARVWYIYGYECYPCGWGVGQLAFVVCRPMGLGVGHHRRTAYAGFPEKHSGAYLRGYPAYGVSGMRDLSGVEAVPAWEDTLYS